MFGSYTVRKALALFSQKLVTSGAMRSKRKMNSTAGALVSNQNVGSSDQVPNGANHPDYPVTASNLGERLIEKASRSSYSEPACDWAQDRRRPAELQRR